MSVGRCVKRVGQLKGARDPILFEWEIDNFLNLATGECKYYDSFRFFFCDSAWCLRVHMTCDYIGVYVKMEYSPDPVTVTYSLFLKKTDSREELVNESTKTFHHEGSAMQGVLKAIERSEIVNQKSKFLPSGVLTVVCSMKCDNKTRGVEGAVKLSSDFEGLLVSGDQSDFTVVVQGEEFRLHRAVLAARSPVFSSMFQHEMKEKVKGVAEPEWKADTFRVFVQYLYTGSTFGLSTGNVFELYRIADCYQVEELKPSCRDHMKLNLSVDTFCETLGLALQHEERNLVEHASDFLPENARDIMDRDDWLNLMRSHTKGINEFLKQNFIKNKKFKR